MSETKHSPEPWVLTGDDEEPIRGVLRVEDNGACGDPECCGDYRESARASDADLRRLVACVNACAGIPTEALEAGRLNDALTIALDVMWSTEPFGSPEYDSLRDHLANALRALGRLP